MNAFDEARGEGTARYLFALTDRLYRATQLEDAFDAALDTIVGMLGCERASILMFDGEGVMRFRAHRGLSEAYRQAVDGHTPWTAGQMDPSPIFVPDIMQTDEADWLKARISAEGIRALGFIPLTVERRVVGKFMTYYPDPREFSTHEQQAAVAIARQLGFFIERAEMDALRLKGEVALRDSEARFRRMAEDAPIMLWLSRPDGSCAYLNRQLREFWGVPEERLGDFDWRETMHPDDGDRVAAAMREATGAKNEVTLKARYRRKSDGQFRLLETVATPNIASDGRFLGMIGVNVDTTDRDEAEAALLNSERRFRELADSMPQLVWTADARGAINYWNSRIALYTPESRSADGTLLWTGLLHPDDLAETTAQWSRATEERRPYEYSHRLLMKDGTYRWHLSRATPVFDEAGTLQQWYGTATDIHELLSYERRLEESEKRQRLAVTVAGLGVFEWNMQEDSAIWTNARMYEVFGHEEKDGPLNWAQFAAHYLHADDRARIEEGLIGAMRGGELPNTAMRYFRKGESVPRWLEAAGIVERDSRGEPHLLVGVVADVTERRRSEDYKNLLIDELNHRVKNTLAVVQSLASQTFRDGVAFTEANVNFRGRLSALAQAHNLLAHESWEKASLADVATSVLAGGHDKRINIAGALVQLRPKQALSLAMALHELHTNAMKYGALRDDAGRVDVSWTLLPLGPRKMLTIRWSETSALPVSPPGKPGFGSVMIRQALKSELGADVQVNYGEQGLTCMISADLSGAE